MSCKALGLALRETISGTSNDFGTGLPYILIVLTIIFIGIQMTYLNKGELRTLAVESLVLQFCHF